MTFFKSVIRPRLDHRHVAVRIDTRNIERGCVPFLEESRRVLRLLDNVAPYENRIADITEDIRDLRKIISVEKKEVPTTAAVDNVLSRLYASKNFPALACHLYVHHRVNPYGVRVIAPVLAYTVGVDLRCANGIPGTIASVTRALDDVVSETWTDDDRERCIAEIPRAFENACDVIDLLNK